MFRMKVFKQGNRAKILEKGQRLCDQDEDVIFIRRDFLSPASGDI
jgi:hypothetical protein